MDRFERLGNRYRIVIDGVSECFRFRDVLKELTIRGFSEALRSLM